MICCQVKKLEIREKTDKHLLEIFQNFSLQTVVRQTQVQRQRHTYRCTDRHMQVCPHRQWEMTETDRAKRKTPKKESREWILISQLKFDNQTWTGWRA